MSGIILERANALLLLALVAVVPIGCSDAAATSPADAGAADVLVADAGTSTPDAAIDATADAPTPEVSCSKYCAIVASNCPGAHAQFGSSDECMAVCADMPPGVFADSDDSLGCREAHAIAASGDPATNCAAAGPFGGGACGDRCDDYCSVMLSRCTGPNAPYDNKTVCWNDCLQHFPFDTGAAEYTDSGNTLNCREGFLESIGAVDGGDRAAACAAAGPQSTPCR